MQISNLGLTNGADFLLPDNTASSLALEAKAKGKSDTPSYFSDTVALSSQAQDAGNATITLNLHNISAAQTLELEQTLGLGDAVSFSETQSTRTVSQISQDTTPGDLISELGDAAQFQAANGSTGGSAAYLALQKELLSVADSNGNVTLNAATFYNYAAQDATNTYQ